MALNHQAHPCILCQFWPQTPLSNLVSQPPWSAEECWAAFPHHTGMLVAQWDCLFLQTEPILSSLSASSWRLIFSRRTARESWFKFPLFRAQPNLSGIFINPLNLEGAGYRIPTFRICIRDTHQGLALLFSSPYSNSISISLSDNQILC